MSFISSVCHDDVILYFINVNMVHRYIFVYYHQTLYMFSENVMQVNTERIYIITLTNKLTMTMKTCVWIRPNHVDKKNYFKLSNL